MAGKDPDDYRPRRAFDATPDPDSSRPAKGSSGSGSSSGKSGAGTGRTGAGSGTGKTGAGSGRSRSGSDRDVEPDRSTTILPRVRDDRSTSVLPKTTERRRRDELDDDEADVRPPLSQRSAMILLGAGIAAVVILGLVLGNAVLNNGQPAAEPSTGVSVNPTTGESVSPTPVALLDDSSMMNEQMAGAIDDKRTWQVASTQRGLDDSSPRAACFPSDPVDGQPDPQQTIQRLLSSNGKNPPAVLHQAESYGTPEEAAQAYVAISKALGSCAVVGGWIAAGESVSGLGDQSAAAKIEVTDAGKQSFHTMVINRTGRVVDVVDVAQPGEAVGVYQVAKALGGAVTVQCKTSGGACVKGLKVKAAPPPLGGDEPGFLAAGDLPPAGKTPSLWVGSTPAAPNADYIGANCETTDWATVDAAKRSMRTYTMQDNASVFGVDQIVLTMDDEKAAGSLVEKVKKDLESCKDRKLTATVAKLAEIKGPGAENNEVSGWATEVSHKTASTTVNFRVGIVAVGSKVVWTLANPADNLDFADDQWPVIALRAGQRASQVQ